ncbi:hypothetical protein KGY79_09860 [Candidatus Bipolaricaulota bacterium]|nr:hypothetical protein [Candidatus Bipolaricaulota bacterium]
MGKERRRNRQRVLGFEADAIPPPRMKTIIRKNIEPYISTTPLVRQRRQMGTVADALDSWALARIRGGLSTNE